MKLSFLVAFVSLLVSFIPSQALAFENETIWGAIHKCWADEQTAEACVNEETEKVCSPIAGLDRVRCEYASQSALQTFRANKADERAKQLEAQLAATRQAQPVVAPPPVVASVPTRAPEPVVTAPPPTRSVAVVSNPPTRTPLGTTPGSQTAVYLSPQPNGGGSINGLGRWGGAYVVYIGGSEIPAHVKRQNGTEWTDVIGQRVDLNGDGDITLDEENVQVVSADNGAIYFAGNVWDGQVTVRWVNFRWDPNAGFGAGAWRPVKKANLVFDYSGGRYPRFYTDVHVSDFRS
jgi:hypothetical protein